MKHIFTLILGLLMSISLVSAQVGGKITLANGIGTASEYYFDIYLEGDGVSGGPIYLGDSQFRISFDLSKFDKPTLEIFENINSVTFLNDGLSTLVPKESGNANSVANTRSNYIGAMSVSIRPENPNILNIELSGPAPSSLPFFDNRVAEIDDKAITHRLARFVIKGYLGSGDPDLQIEPPGIFGTAVLTYDRDDTTTPFAQSVVVLDNGTLPVEWLSFKARKLEHQEVELEWITGSELNNDYFQVEKKLKYGEFEVLGNVDSRGNSTTAQVYQFIDNTPMTPTVFYRIKQIDLDGTFEYSNTVEVEFESDTENAYNVFPSPAEEEITIEALVNTNEAHKYWILDLRGREVINGEIEPDQEFKKINITNLAEGNYFVKIEDPQQNIHHLKFTKEY